jgi:hypothetical protein
LKRPSVYLSNKILPKNQAELKEVIKRHGGKLSTTTTKATHIVEPDLTPPEEEDDYVRIIERKPTQCLVHWWYYPDSYENWIPSSEVEGEDTDPDFERAGPWTVTSRWLTDTEFFNEWMNELDYEVAAPIAEQAIPEQPLKTQKSKSKKPKSKAEENVDQMSVEPTGNSFWHYRENEKRVISMF